MPDPYQLDLTAAQVNTAVNAAYDSDRQPAAGQTTLCNGDKIAAAIAGAVGVETSAREAADTALDGRVTALEGDLPTFAKFAKSNFSITLTSLISGYTEVDADNIAAESSGVITVTGSGIYMVSYTISGISNSFSSTAYFTVHPRIDGSSVFVGYLGTGANGVYPTSFSHTEVVTSVGSFTASLYLVESGTASLISSFAQISITKLS